MNMKRKQAEDKKDADLKAAHMYLGVMSNDAFSDELKIKAQNNFADLFQKGGYGEMPKVTEWSPEFGKASKKGLKTFEMFKNGEISFEDGIANLNSLAAEAKNAAELKRIDTMRGGIAKMQARKEYSGPAGKVSPEVMAELEPSAQKAYGEDKTKIPIKIDGVDYQLGPTEWASVKNAMERMDQGWSAPYAGPGGSLLQKNNKGEVKSILGRHEPKGAGDSMAKAANLRMVKENVMKMWLPLAEKNIKSSAKSPEEAQTKMQELMAGLFTTDEFGRHVNEARVFSNLPKDQQKYYRQHMQYAEDSASNLNPARAAEEGLNKLYKSWEQPAEKSTDKSLSKGDLTKEQAALYLKEAKGDRKKAEKMARDAGWKF